jgi:hypothetical protein
MRYALSAFSDDPWESLFDGRPAYWQFKNGAVARCDLDEVSARAAFENYTDFAWDRSLGGWVLYRVGM